MNDDNQNQEQAPVEKPPLPESTDSSKMRDGRTAAELAVRSGRSIREAKERGEEVDDGFVDPNKIAEHLDAEAEREAGAPDASSEIAPYEAVPPEYAELAKEYHEDFTAIAKDASIPAGEAENLLHFIMGRTVEDVQHDASALMSAGMVKGPDLSNRDQCMTLLRRRYGNLTDGLIQQSAKAFARLPAKVQRYLDSDPTGKGEILSNSPAIVAGLALWGSGFMRQTPEAAQKELDALSKKSTVDNYTKDRIAVLRHIVSRAAGSREHAGLKKALADKKAPAPQMISKIDARIAAIRRDPNYHKSDNRTLHRALVDEMAELYSQRSGGK